MPLLARMPFLMFAGRLVPGLCKILISAPAAAALRHEHPLSWRCQIRDGFAILRVEYQRSHWHLQKHVVPGMPRTIRSFSVASAVCLELAIVPISKQRVVVRVCFQVNAP